MSNGGDLLRMLMPAVRPVPTEGVSRPGKQPIESLSFDSLLQEAKQSETIPGLPNDPTAPTDPTTATENTEQPAKPDALAPLSGLDSIHNASLRRIVAQAANSQ